MKIEVIKIPRNKEKTDADLVFVDDDNKEIVGHCNYSINNNIGNIYDTYIYPDYRGQKIMKKYIDDILCDMKCMGVTTVKLSTLSDEGRIIWKKLGFKHTDKKGNMEINVSNRKCNCLCGIHSFTDEIDIKKVFEYVYKQ